MMLFPNSTIQIFAKAPVVGQVKTRLIPALGEERAAELHRQMTERTINSALHSELAPVELWCASDCDHPFFTEQQRCLGVSLFEQQGEDLGERMYQALNAGLQQGPVVLIGCDCPMISAEYLQQALQQLVEGVDVVLGPAEDGGYVLIGVNRLDRVLFKNICWGGDQVFSETVKRIERLGWHYRVLPMVWDVDRIEDVERLMAESF